MRMSNHERGRGRASSAGVDPFANMSVGTLTRRSAIAILAGWSVLSTATAMRRDAPPEPRPAGRAPSLGALAANNGLIFGASIASQGVATPEYRQLYLDQARILTSDWAMKFATVRPDAGAPRHADGDLLIDFATHNNMLFRGHALIWNESNPDWIKSLSASEIGALLDRHVDEMVGRYAGRVHSWDVVNEPFWPDHKAPGFFRKGPWFNTLGPDYIARALRRAAAADPKTKLVINEAFTERGDGLGLEVRRRLLRLIDDLQHAGVPLHAIGLESHLQPQFASDDVGFQVFLDEISRRGLEIYLTELDVDDLGLPGDPAARDEIIADRVYAYLNHALACPAVKVLECWQLSDRYSWYADPAIARKRGRAARPLPFDEALNRKPMFDAIARALAARVS